MSALLLANAPFLSVLLNTTKLQQRKLLQSLTPIQEKLLIEIFTNLFNLPHTDEDRLFIKKKRNFLKHFKNGVSIKTKRNQLKRVTYALNILEHFKGKIQALL